MPSPLWIPTTWWRRTIWKSCTPPWKKPGRTWPCAPWRTWTRPSRRWTSGCSPCPPRRGRSAAKSCWRSFSAPPPPTTPWPGTSSTAANCGKTYATPPGASTRTTRWPICSSGRRRRWSALPTCSISTACARAASAAPGCAPPPSTGWTRRRPAAAFSPPRTAPTWRRWPCRGPGGGIFPSAPSAKRPLSPGRWPPAGRRPRPRWPPCCPS